MMSNLNMFFEVQPPLASKAQSLETFKNYKITETPVSKKRVCSLQWNKSGNKIAMGCYDTTIKMYSLDGSNLSKIQDFKGHSDQVQSLSWHPQNESVFVSTSADKTIRIWDSKAGKSVRTEKTKEENLNLTFNPDGNILGVSNIKEELCFFDFRMWKMLKQIKFKNEVNDFTWDKSQNGQALFVADSSGAITVYNGQTLSSTPLTILNFHYTACNTLAIDPSNNYFISGGSDSLIGMWDMQEMMVFRTVSNNDFKVLVLNVSHDGQYIASICEDDINKKFVVEVYDGVLKPSQTDLQNSSDAFLESDRMIIDNPEMDSGNYLTQSNKQNTASRQIQSSFNSSSLMGLNNNQTLYSYSSSSTKYCLQWHPKRHILAFAGEEKNEGVVQLLQPSIQA